MRIMHIALGGCLSAGPIQYGLTEDTGGHIAYILGATEALAKRAEISAIDIVTRSFHDPQLGAQYAESETVLDSKRRIQRLATPNPAYLEKADLLAELPALTEAFLQLVERGPRPDVIHAHFADAAVLAQFAKKRFGIPWAFSAHSLGLQKGGAGVCPRRLDRERAAVENADAIVASSRDEAERQIPAYSANAGGRTYRVDPGVLLLPDQGPQQAERLIAPWLRDIDRPIVLAIARPVEKKNNAALVDAYAGSAALRARANLVIVAGQRQRIGDTTCETGQVITNLFDTVDRNDLWGQVALPRTHTAEEVRSLYALAQRGGVFVNPAFFEPFGLTVVEAVKSGVPVVATRHGGPVNILEDVGYGLTVEPTSPEEIAAACLAMLDDPAREKRAIHAQMRARELYSWSGWAAKVASIYDTLGRSTAVALTPGRLLVSDMDDTLTGDRPAAARLARRLARTPNIALVVATGRSVTEARRVLSAWGLPEPNDLITSVGSEIWRRNGDSYALDTAYAAHIGQNWDAAAVLTAGRDAGLTPQAAYEQRPWKRSFAGSAADGVRLERHLPRLGLSARVIVSHGCFIDVVPAHAGKAAAAQHVAQRYGLTNADCLGAGDSGNDRDLLLWAGRSVVPANGLPEIADLGHQIYRASVPFAAGVMEAMDLWERDLAAPVVVAAE